MMMISYLPILADS